MSPKLVPLVSAVWGRSRGLKTETEGERVIDSEGEGDGERDCDGERVWED